MASAGGDNDACGDLTRTSMRFAARGCMQRSLLSLPPRLPSWFPPDLAAAEIVTRIPAVALAAGRLLFLLALMIARRSTRDFFACGSSEVAVAVAVAVARAGSGCRGASGNRRLALALAFALACVLAPAWRRRC